MISQEFTVEALNRLRRSGSQFKYQTDEGEHPKSAAEWKAFLTSVQSEILDGSFVFRPFIVVPMPKGKRMFMTHSLENIMVMRKINDNIRRAYRIKQANRLDTIRQVQQALRETSPKHVIRLDIRSFYETVPRRSLIDRLRADRLVSTRTLDLLARLLRLVGHQGAPGLPRGLQISATLAELHASKLERELRAIEGVYYVARYVDDIVVLSYVDYRTIASKIREAFTACRLRLNTDKLEDEPVVNCRCQTVCIHTGARCACDPKCKCVPTLDSKHIRSVDILGYRLAFPDVNEKKDRVENDVRVYMADRKIAKYRRRFHFAIQSYLSNGDFRLLTDRVVFLTSNHKLQSTKIGGSLKGGVYYNFSLYDPYEDSTIFPENRLDFLDKVLKAGLASALLIRPAPTRNDRRKLLSMSFVGGHHLRRLHSLSPKRIIEVGECWSEA
jgi:hypothetical protein